MLSSSVQVVLDELEEEEDSAPYDGGAAPYSGGTTPATATEAKPKRARFLNIVLPVVSLRRKLVIKEIKSSLELLSVRASEREGGVNESKSWYQRKKIELQQKGW